MSLISRAAKSFSFLLYISACLSLPNFSSENSVGCEFFSDVRSYDLIRDGPNVDEWINLDALDLPPPVWTLSCLVRPTIGGKSLLNGFDIGATETCFGSAGWGKFVNSLLEVAGPSLIVTSTDCCLAMSTTLEPISKPGIKNCIY